jgi:hypothetical protein
VYFLAAIASSFAIATACGATTGDVAPGADGGPGSSGGVATGSLPCDVDAVLAQNCRKCHSSSPQYGAPMPLVTLADLHAAAKSDAQRKVYELVPERIADDTKPMPPPPNARLADADRATLTKWAQAGAPASTDACGATPPTPPPVPPTACTPDLPLTPASPWTMPSSSGDVYVCYGVDVQRATPTHAVGFAPRVDNPKIVHHVLLFEADSSYGATPQACSAGGSLQWRLVTGWAPGAKGFEMPPEAGFPIGTDTPTHYVVQVHYSNPQALSGETDTSGFSLCTAPPRANEADVMAFGTQNFTIPPGPYSRTCTVDVPSQLAGIKLVAAMPHMHKLGTSISTTLTPSGGGTPVDLGTIAAFSFNNQAWLPLNATVGSGDTITTKCSWANTTGAPVKYGENTANEMCYSFTVYYPKVNLSVWSWAVPAATSTCQ